MEGSRNTSLRRGYPPCCGADDMISELKPLMIVMQLSGSGLCLGSVSVRVWRTLPKQQVRTGYLRGRGYWGRLGDGERDVQVPVRAVRLPVGGGARIIDCTPVSTILFEEAQHKKRGQRDYVHTRWLQRMRTVKSTADNQSSDGGTPQTEVKTKCSSSCCPVPSGLSMCAALINETARTGGHG